MCPFCCMYSSPQNQGFMRFDTFQSILDKNVRFNINRTQSIIQLEGGEPLLHPQLFLFLKYACSIDTVVEIVIDTNGKHLLGLIDKIVEVAGRNKKPITIKPSINSYLIRQDPQLLKRCDNLSSACEFLEYVNMVFNIRWHDKEDYDMMLSNGVNKLLEKPYFKYTSFQFNKYGRAKDDEVLPPIKITPTYNEWKLFSVDGTEFSDLEKRSNYENMFEFELKKGNK